MSPGASCCRELPSVSWRRDRLTFPLALRSRQRYPEELSGDNAAFLREVVADRYESPLRQAPPAAPLPFTPGVRRCGLVARKIAVQPLWLSNGKYVNTTLLHVGDARLSRGRRNLTSRFAE